MVVLKKSITFLLSLAMLFTLLATPALAANDQHGIYYRHARIFGKAIRYDQNRDLLIVYGSLMVPTPGSWKTLESKKFHLAQPAYQSLRQEIATIKGKTVALEGELSVWPGQKEEVLTVKSIKYQDYEIEIPEWYGFGLTQRTEQAYKLNLNTPVEFLSTLNSLATTMGVPQDGRMTKSAIDKTIKTIKNPSPDERKYVNRLTSELNAKWNKKWYVVKNNNTANELRTGVGGWQFYHGLLGNANCYVEDAPITRKHIDKFMDAVRTGGLSPEEEGIAIMCAYIAVKRDEYDNIKKVDISGALYDKMPNFYRALRDTTPNQESWRLENWSKREIESMEGKLCWVIGRRNIDYDENGNIEDQYFSLTDYLTRDGFNNTLDLLGEIIREGGVSG